MSQEKSTASQKSRLTLLILYLVPPFNVWSAYCFYAGKIFYGLIRMALLLFAGHMATEDEDSVAITVLGLCGLLTVIDFFRIILGNYKDKQGNLISSWNPKKDLENQFAAVLAEVKEFCSLEPKPFTDFEDRSTSNSDNEFWFPKTYTRCDIIGKNVLQYFYNPQGEMLIAVSGDRFLYFSAHIEQKEDNKKVNHICISGNNLQKHEKDILLSSENNVDIGFLDSINSLSSENEKIGEILTSYFEKLEIRRKNAEIEKQEAEKQQLLREQEEAARRIEEEKRRVKEEAERKAAEEKAYKEEHPEEAQALADLDAL